MAVAEATGWYVEVSADGFRVGAGCYRMGTDRLAAFRSGVAEDRKGTELERIVAELRGAGWEVEGDRLVTAPRGISRDHPRIELLRHRSLAVSRWIEDADMVTTPLLLPEVRKVWTQLRPLVEWLAVSGSAR